MKRSRLTLVLFGGLLLGSALLGVSPAGSEARRP